MKIIYWLFIIFTISFLNGYIISLRRVENKNKPAVFNQVIHLSGYNIQKNDHVFGQQDSRTVIIEYGDFNCPFSAINHSVLNNYLKKNNNVFYVFRYAPLSFHTTSEKEAIAAECSAVLGGNKKFLEYIEKRFSANLPSNDIFHQENILGIAENLGLDKNAFTKCLDDENIKKKVLLQFEEVKKLDVKSTPLTIVQQDKKVVFSSTKPLTLQDLVKWSNLF